MRLSGTLQESTCLPSHQTRTRCPRQLIFRWCQASWSSWTGCAAFAASGSSVTTFRVRGPKATSFSCRTESANCAPVTAFCALASALAWLSASIIRRVIEPQVIGVRAVRQVLEGEAEVQQTAAPAPAGQEVRPPFHVHLQVVAVRFQGGRADGLFIACRGVQHRILVSKPAVEIPVPRRDTGVMLRFERPAVHQLLPHAVVRGKINMLEQLPIQHWVDVPGRLPGLHPDGPLREGRYAHGDSNDE